MANFYGAYYVVSGVSFAVLLVASSSANTQHARESTTAYFQPFFPNVPIVLAIRLTDGRLQFWGESNLTKYLAKAGEVRWCDWSFD